MHHVVHDPENIVRQLTPLAGVLTLASGLTLKQASNFVKNEAKLMTNKPTRQTSPRISTLAANVLSGRVRPTAIQIKSLAASALGQDQKKGQK
jgi:hypothetical protein